MKKKRLTKAEIDIVRMLELESDNSIENHIEEKIKKGLPLEAAKFTINIQTWTVYDQTIPALGSITPFPVGLADETPNFAFPIFGYYDLLGKSRLFQELAGINRMHWQPFLGGFDPSYQPEQWQLYNIGLFDQSFTIPNYIQTDGPQLVEPSAKFHRISKLFKLGDLFIIYIYPRGVDVTTNYFQIIRVSLQEVSYASFLYALASEKIYFKNMKYTLLNAGSSQINEPISIIKQGIFGQNKIDSFSIQGYKDPKEYQSDIYDIPLNILIGKYEMLIYKLDPNTRALQLDFDVIKFTD